MIPYQVALLAWIPVAALLMMDENRARGFSLATLLGLLILPEALEIELPGVPDLNKLNVIFIGILLGTIVFHPRAFDRFTLIVGDFLLLACLFVAFLSAYLNDGSITYCISRTFTLFFGFILPVLLARIHIGTPNGVRTFLLWTVAAAVVYAPFALWEFRMSPQLHANLYGYFQHVFQQHFRGGYWRPIVCFSHALALGRFFAFTAFLALFPLRKDLVALLGRAGHFVFLAPLVGLLLSMSFSPYLVFGLLVAGYFLIQRQWLLAYVLPVAALLWLTIVFIGMRPGHGFVEDIAAVSAERAASLQYRLDAWQEYKSVVQYRPVFGYGGWGGGRIEGRATDSQLLISLLDRGLVGTVFYFGWWFYAMYAALRVMTHMQGRVFARRAAAVAMLSSIAIAMVTIDAAFDMHLLVTGAAMVSIYTWVRMEPRLPNESATALLPAQQPG
ncbi:MAG TPA: hypothetical protein PKI11_05825 [Candidatus Hydrogenedentes bacterium]|nr:hypothetical protein [Candidatus Hydrogenedentota bacterium]